MLRRGGIGPQILPMPPKFLIRSIVISLAVFASQMMKGQAREIFFPRTATVSTV